METVAMVIFMISAVVVIAMILIQSFGRAKSSLRWVKGISFQEQKSLEEVFECIKQINHPAVNSVDYNSEGKIVVHTKIYDFPVEVTENKEGNTTIGFIVDWNKLSKNKRKKVALLFDEICVFTSHIVEGKDLSEAMKVYKKNLKISRALFIAGCVTVVAVILFALQMVSSPVKEVQNLTREGYGDITVKEAVESWYSEDVSWEGFVSTDDRNIVEFNGSSPAENGGDSVCIQFEYDDGEIDIVYMDLNGTSMTQLQWETEIESCFIYCEELKEN